MTAMTNFDHRRATIKCFALISVSIIFLPLSFVMTIVCVILNYVQARDASLRRKCQNEAGFKQHIVLVTGVGMTKGLAIARSMYLAGHRVIGADFEDSIAWCSGRFSKSVSKFVKFQKLDSTSTTETYVQSLVDVIRTYQVDLWISCSGVGSAIEDARVKEDVEKATSCRCIQFGVELTSKLHEKHTFIKHTTSIGLPVPDTYEVNSYKQAVDFLSNKARSTDSQKYIIKPIGMDDAYRGDLTLLPMHSWKSTEAHVNRLPISTEKPWIIQQFIHGNKEYCTHALVVEGRVRAFTACPSSELLMHYQALTKSDPLYLEMLWFTKSFISRTDSTMTGHLSFDFMLDKDVRSSYQIKPGPEARLVAIECNPRAHTAVVLFTNFGKDIQNMAQAYISSIEKSKMMPVVKDIGLKTAKSKQAIVTPSDTSPPRYWIGHDVVELLLQPLWNGVVYQKSTPATEYLQNIRTFIRHVLCWKEGIFEIWDPLPFLILYHWYWPITIFMAWWRGFRWSRANVSTTKMFAC